MQHVAVHVGQVVLPELLLLGEHQLFQLFVRRDGDKGGGGLEGDAAFQAEDRVAQVDAPAHAVLAADSASAAMSSSGAIVTPSSATGRPSSKLRVSIAGWSGASAGAAVSTKALLGRVAPRS